MGVRQRTKGLVDMELVYFVGGLGFKPPSPSLSLPPLSLSLPLPPRIPKMIRNTRKITGQKLSQFYHLQFDAAVETWQSRTLELTVY